jgi:hypothetical protein
MQNAARFACAPYAFAGAARNNLAEDLLLVNYIARLRLASPCRRTTPIKMASLDFQQSLEERRYFKPRMRFI